MTFCRVLAIASILLCSFVSVSASATCKKIASTKSITIEYPLSIPYLQDQSQYWYAKMTTILFFFQLIGCYRSASCSSLLPACILVPGTPNELSTIVRTLLGNSESFAVKAGGHNPNRFYSSIHGGPLINLKGLNEVTYDLASGTVKVGPGNRWSDVAKALGPYNVTVVGGRIGHVGVGGYLVGGEIIYAIGLTTN